MAIREFSGKLWFTFFLLTLGFAGVFVRIWYISTSGKISLPQWKNTFSPTLRGCILDRDGGFLALTVSSASIYLRPFQFRDPEKTMQVLARATGLPVARIKQRISQGGDRFVWLMRQVSEETGRRVRESKLRGVYVTAEPRRVYPAGKLAAHVLGFSGVDHLGLTGAEKAWDGILLPEKTPGNRIKNIVLTLDNRIQYIVEDEIGKTLKSSGARNVTAIVMEPHSGELLAMASAPSFDPNDFTAFPQARFVNPAITRTYEPGSTFKIFSSLHLLNNNRVSLQETFSCTGAIELFKHKITCTHAHGVRNLAGILGLSCNVGIVKLSHRLARTPFHRHLRQLGFGSMPGTELPGESGGLLHPPNTWSGLSRSMISIGYEISVTPLQLIRAAAALANNGMLMRPRILKAVTDWEGTILWSATPEPAGRVASPYIANLMLKLLQGSVAPWGTGARAALPGIAISGKTGTAHIPRGHGRGYDTSRINASFIGYLPYRKRTLVILVLVQEPDAAPEGGMVAAPVFREIGQRIRDYLDRRMGKE